VVVVALVAHMTALAGGYVWLDHAHIEDGLAVARPAEWVALFGRGFAGTGFYRPLTALSLSIDGLVGRPWFFHATTVAWHAAAAAMILPAGEALGLGRRAALMAGILFAVHPVSSLVASAIAFRSESMMCVALLSLVVAHRRHQPWLAGLSLGLGALVKETALVLGPLFIAALELDRRWAQRKEAVERRPARLVLAEAAALAAVLGLRFAYAPSWRAFFPGLSLSEAVGTRLASLAKSGALAVAPVDRSVCDAFPITRAPSLAAAAGAAVAVLVIWLAWRRRGPALLMALALLASLNLVPTMRWWSPHYVYLPMAFAVMLLAEVVERVGSRAMAATGAVAAVLAAVTLADDRRFRSDEALWAPEVARQPQCREGHFYLAEVRRQAGDWERAAHHYQLAAAPAAGFLAFAQPVAALQNLGAVRLQQRRWHEARAAYRAALAEVRDPIERRRIVHNLATTEMRAGRPKEAADLLESETSRPDAFAPSILLRAAALRRIGRENEAQALIQRLEKLRMR
jgi:tetratricopeptide (TPR) repeat protein